MKIKSRYKIVDLNSTKNQYIGGGIDGDYYKISKKRGVKVFKYLGRATIKACRREIKKVHAEANNILKLQKFKMTPKFYDICIVKKVGGSYHPAILMEHLNEYKPLGDYWDSYGDLSFDKKFFKTPPKNARGLDVWIGKAFTEKTKYQHPDIHNHNILIKVKNKVIKDVKLVDLTYITK